MKVSMLPLNELYARPKITASVEAAILAKEDFSKISPTYCETVCKLKCKDAKSVRLLNTEVDILVIQDHEAMNGKFDKREGQQEAKMKSLIEFVAKQADFAGLTYRVTSLLKCKPTEQDFPRGKAPTATTLMKCKPYLWQEIKNSKPKVIISLSTAVTKALGLKKHSNSGNRGEIVESEYGPVVLTIHPRALTMIRQNASGAFWSADFTGIIIRDFQKAAQIAKGELVPVSLGKGIEMALERIEIAKNIDDVRRFMDTLNALPPQSLVSFDTETTGLDGMAEDAKVLCIQFGWRDPETRVIRAAVIPLWHRENKAYNPDEAWEIVHPFLTGTRGKVAHNGKFDILYIYHTTGIRVRNLKFDTMLLLHSIDSGTQGCYGLKTAVTDYMPESGLSGYETLLPKLTRIKDDDEITEEEENDDGSV